MSKEFVPQNREVVDIFERGYQFHFTTPRKLPRILSEGIFSHAFARRIKDPRFSVLDEDQSPSVWATYGPRQVFMAVPDYNRIVGIVIDPPKSQRGPLNVTHFRIAPREFAGLVVIDTLPIGKEVDGHLYKEFGDKLIGDLEMENLLKRVEEYKKLMAENSKTRQLPIYGTSGSLYSPYRLSYKALAIKLSGH